MLGVVNTTSNVMTTVPQADLIAHYRLGGADDGTPVLICDACLGLYVADADQSLAEVISAAARHHVANHYDGPRNPA